MAEEVSATQDIPAVYRVESIEQLRALADELRVRIFTALTQRPLTATQVGDELGVAAPKAHYHVRELERVGLVRLVETRERGGILEKYFRAVAKDVQVSHALLRRAPDETMAYIGDQLGTIERGFTSAFSRALATEGPAGAFIQLSTSAVWATDDEMRDLARRFGEMCERYLAPRSGEGVRQRMLVMMGYDAGADGTETSVEAAPNQAATTFNEARPGPAPQPRRVSVVGVLTYARSDLERVVAAGEALDLHIVGACIVAGDVTPELVDRAIARFRLRGKLTASPEVRAVLEHKQPPRQRQET